jgi:hypothetical protein
MHCSSVGRLLLLALLVCLARVGVAAESERSISLADGKLQLTAPESWERKKPSSNIIEFEFAVPAAKGDENAGRVTIMGAGGSVEANIDRWVGQFTQPDGSDTKKAAKIEQKKIGGQEVHLVDISGTYKDQRGPFAGGPVVERKGYRMLSAIVVTKEAGNYFVKFYGPEKTVGDNREKFDQMIDSLSVK